MKRGDITAEESGFLKCLLVDIVEVLIKEFYGDNLNLVNNQQEIDTEQALLNLFEVNQESLDPSGALISDVRVGNSQYNPPQISSKEQAQSQCLISCSPEVKAIIESLQARIKELESAMDQRATLPTSQSQLLLQIQAVCLLIHHEQ